MNVQEAIELFERDPDDWCSCEEIKEAGEVLAAEIQKISAVFEILPSLLDADCKIAKQDGKWCIFKKDGDGLVSGVTFREMCEKLLQTKQTSAKKTCKNSKPILS